MGCDGSVNDANINNKGLNYTMGMLQRGYDFDKFPFKKFINDHLSLADWAVLAQLRAVGYGIKNANNGYANFNNKTSVFKYGRISNPKGAFKEDVEGKLPQGGDGWKDNMDKIKAGLKGLINDADLVTLLGCHVAGTMEKQNSGY